MTVSLALREEASTKSMKVTRYLPQTLRGMPVLFHEGGSVYRVDNGWLNSERPRLAYRLSKNIDDKDDDKQGAGPRWSDRIAGIDEGDGWIKIEVQGNANHDQQVSLVPRGGSCAEQPQQLLEDVLVGAAAHHQSSGSSRSSSSCSRTCVDSDAAVEACAVEEIDMLEFECSICLDVLAQPVRLPCSHAFCRYCILKSYNHRRTCPMCRAEMPKGFNPRLVSVDRSLRDQIKRASAAKSSSVVTTEEVRASPDTRWTSVQQLQFGNRAERIPSLKGVLDKHGKRIKEERWTLFVQLDGIYQYLIQSVRFRLPFHIGESVLVEKAPFRMTRLDQGQGPFTVQIDIAWKPEANLSGMTLEHVLSLDRGGASRSVTITLPTLDSKFRPRSAIEVRDRTGMPNSVERGRRSSVSMPCHRSSSRSQIGQ